MRRHTEPPWARARLQSGQPPQWEIGHLPRPIGRTGRDTVHKQAHATHPETGSRPITAHRNLQVLGIVLAIANHQARHTRQALRQIDLGLPIAQRFTIDHIDGRGPAPNTAARPFARHHHGRQRARVCRGRSRSRFNLGVGAPCATQGNSQCHRLADKTDGIIHGDGFLLERLVFNPSHHRSWTLRRQPKGSGTPELKKARSGQHLVWIDGQQNIDCRH